MKKLIAVVAIAALCGTTAFAQPTLDLSIQATDIGGGQYTIDIIGLMGGDSHDGLALWACNLEATAGDLDVDIDGMAAVGDMTAFDKNDGLTNPAGYGGTPSAGALIQIGGGQNTIGNTNPPAYPIGAVITGVGNTAVVLATGTYTMPDGVDEVTLTIDTAFANALNPGGGPDVYAVTAIESVGISVPSVTVGGATADAPVFSAISSVAEHIGAGEFGLAIDPALTDADARAIEPRDTTVDGAANPYIAVQFDKSIATAAGTVTPAIAGVTFTVDAVDDTIVLIEFAGDMPADDTYYLFDLTGTVAADGGAAGDEADADFWLGYVEADSDASGIVGTLDKANVAAKWGQAPTTADVDTITADLDRSGLVGTLDKAKVAANWGDSGV